MSLLAPADWEPGQGSVTLSYAGDTVIDAPVAVGPGDPISVTGTVGAVEVVLTFPSGIPTDSQVVATVSVTDAGQRLRPDVSADTGFRKALILGIAYAGTIGGVGSAIGTPGNQLAIEFLDAFGGRSISFMEWFAFGLPMVVVFVPIMAPYL